MLVTTLFWIAFLLPGYAVVRRLGDGEREWGLLPAIGWSFVATLFLLSPLSIACYALGLPVAVLTVGFALLLLGALVVLVRRDARNELASLVRAEPVAPWVGVLALLVLQARLGGWLDGDATYHLGRVRDLLDHGFGNNDIYLAEPHFQHIYHTNLLHALHAVLARVTQQSYLDSWFYTQPAMKLLMAAGYYTLAYAVGRARALAWLFALAALAASAGETYTLYPNTLAVHCLLPLALAAGVTWLAPAPALRWPVLRLLALSLVLAQVHSLYALYLGLLLGPCLAGVAIVGRLRDRQVVLAALALLAGAPFLLVSKYAHLPERAAATRQVDEAASANADHATRQDAQVQVQPRVTLGTFPATTSKPPPRVRPPRVYASGGGHLEKQLEATHHAQLRLPIEQIGGLAYLVVGLACLGLLVCWQRPGRAPWVFCLVVAAALGCLLFVPALCTLSLALLQTQFAVARLGTVLGALLLLGVCGVVHHCMLRAPAPRFSAPALALLLLAGATQLRGYSPRTFSEHVKAALAPHAQRHQLRHQLHEGQRMLVRVLPAQALVLAHSRLARTVLMLYDGHVIAADRGHTHVPGIAQRRRDLEVLNARRTKWDDRKRLLDRYDVHYLVYAERHERNYAWARERGRVLGSAGGLVAVQLL